MPFNLFPFKVVDGKPKIAVSLFIIRDDILAQKYQWSTWTTPDPSKKLTGQDLLKFLYDDLFPYLRGLQGNSACSVIRGLFGDAPSKMLKDGAILRDAIDAVQRMRKTTAQRAEEIDALRRQIEAKLTDKQRAERDRLAALSPAKEVMKPRLVREPESPLHQIVMAYRFYMKVQEHGVDLPFGG